MDPETGTILAGKGVRQQTAMASLTKVMTALVAIERGDLDQRVTIVEEDLIGESSADLEEGEDVSLWTLLHGLMMPSGNDAAMAIARAVGGSPVVEDPAARDRFIGWMNRRADELGLTDTEFANPHGLDAPGHYSTVYDLAVLTRIAIRNPTFLIPFGARTYEGDGHEYEHGNKLPKQYPGVIGGKTGWTDNAGLCLIEVAERDGRRLIVVLVGSTFERWYDDAAALLDYGWTLPPPATTPHRAEAVFSWWRSRTDGPVDVGLVQRSWVWGLPRGDGPHYEPYVDAASGRRLVQYFDKGRMEVNEPLANVTSGWYVTGGRLAWEMITGRRQLGDLWFQRREPAAVPLAGDPDNDGPTYATLGSLLSVHPKPAGTVVTQQLRANGNVFQNSTLATYGVTVERLIPETNHRVASVFVEFLEQQGPVIVDGALVERPLFAPAFSVTGYPITEPYWVRAPVDGIERDVLVQCFERRCLTYTPANADGWRVEMGNIGLHYMRWIRGT